MTMFDPFKYLYALKAGETEAFDNKEPKNLAPSLRPSYTKITNVVRNLNLLAPNKQHFSVNRSDDGDSVIVTCTYDGVNGEPFVMKPRKTRGPRKNTRVDSRPDIRTLVAEEVKKALRTGKKSYWLVAASDGVPITAYLSEQAARSSFMYANINNGMIIEVQSV